MSTKLLASIFFSLFTWLVTCRRHIGLSKVTDSATEAKLKRDEINCVEYYPEAEFVQQLDTAIDPCLSCEDIIMFEDDPFFSPGMPEEVCTAGYRKRYCKLAAFTCYLGVEGQPKFCDDAIQTGNGSPETGYKVENVCQRGLVEDEQVDVNQMVGPSEIETDKFRTYLQSVFGDGQMKELVKADASPAGLACIGHKDASACSSAAQGCVYYESLRTSPAALGRLAAALGFNAELGPQLLREQFSWNSGCVPQAPVPVSEATEQARLQWADDSCFLDSAIFSLFGESNVMLDENRLATPAAVEVGDEVDGCGEFIRASLRNVVARLRVAKSVRFPRYVGALRKGLPVACHGYTDFTAMREIANSGAGNFESAMSILLMSMGFEIAAEDLKKGIQAYQSLRAGDVQGPPADVTFVYKADYSLRGESVKLSTDTENGVRADDGPFDAHAYGTMLLVGRSGLRTEFSLSLTNSLAEGVCGETFVDCVRESLRQRGFSFAVPPRRIMLGVDLLSEQRAKAKIPKDFGMDLMLPCETIAGKPGSSCNKSHYRMTSFGAGTEIHQVVFVQAQQGWVFHDDLGGIYEKAHEISMQVGEGHNGYNVLTDGFGLRTSATTLVYELV